MSVSMNENGINVKILNDCAHTYIADIKTSLSNAIYVLGNRDGFSSDMIMHCIRARAINTNTLEDAVARSIKTKASMACKVGMKYDTSTTNEDVSKVAKALGIKTSKRVSTTPILYQGGAVGTGKRR